MLGTLDYFLSKRSELGKTVAEPPFLLFAEAKKNDFDTGWGQCLAEMSSAQKMNELEYAKLLTIFGIVTDKLSNSANLPKISISTTLKSLLSMI